MKKIIIIFLLTYSIGFSQWNLWDGGTNHVTTNVILDSSRYCLRANIFFERCRVKGFTLTDRQKLWYNDSLFVPLIDSGLIGTAREQDSLVFLYVFPIKYAQDSTIANLNILSDWYGCTHYGTVTYSDSGAIGDGATGYLNTFFNPTLDSTIVKKNSIGMGAYTRGSDATIRKVDIGGDINLLYLTWEFYSTTTRLNGDPDAYAVGDYKGLLHTYRNTSTYSQGFKNITSLGTSTNASSGKSNAMTFVMASNESGAARFSPRTYLFAYISTGLSVSKAQKLSNILNNALKSSNWQEY